MKPLHKVALVAGGYIVSLLVAFAAVTLSVAVTSGSARQRAGGMYAFGDTLLFLGVFGVFALVPTAAMLFFLRPYRTFWNLLSTLGLAIAVAGVAAAILFAVSRNESTSRLATLAGYSMLGILISPALALGFLVCAAFSPHRFPRLAFFTAALMEVAVSTYGGAVWIVLQFHHRT